MNKLKIGLLIAGVLVVGIIIGTVGTGSSTTDKLSTSSKEVTRQNSASDENSGPSASTQSSLEIINLTGTGEQVTKKFKLEGSSVFKITSDNLLLQADLLDSRGGKIKFLIGEKDFWHLSNLPQEYLLNVYNFEGPWAIRIESINLASNPEIKQFDGNGSWTTNMFDMKEGLRVIKVTHSGKKNFKVSLYDDNAINWENIPGLLGKIGLYEGSKAVQFRRDGRYFFDIEADGDWVISIE